MSNYPCIFCLDLAIINPEKAPKRPACKPCLDFILSTPDTDEQAFRMGALIAAQWTLRNTSVGEKARDIARQAENLRLRNGGIL